MLCKKCNQEIQEGSTFCNNCGTKTSEKEVSTASSSSKRLIWVGGIVGIILIAGLVWWLFGSQPVSAFKNAVEKNNAEEATKIFLSEIRGDSDKETEVKNYLLSELDDIKQQFVDEKISFDEAIKRLTTVRGTLLVLTETSTVQTEITHLNDSRVAFKTGQEFLNTKNYKEALAELQKVTEEDQVNYTKAQSLIKDSAADYKATTLSSTEGLSSEQKYEDAIALIDEALLILTDDADLLAKKNAYSKLNEEKLAAERKLKMEQLVTQQEVSVIGTKIVSDWLYDEMAEVIVQNNSDKVVKKYTVGYMAYDKDNYPIKVGWLSEDYLKEGVAEANIQPGSSYGKDRGWELKNSAAVKVIACVKEVEFYDGTTWENEYYNYWVEEYKEKPLK